MSMSIVTFIIQVLEFLYGGKLRNDVTQSTLLITWTIPSLQRGESKGRTGLGTESVGNYREGKGIRSNRGWE